MLSIPAPEVVRLEVAAADPAVDAEELDAVGLGAEHTLGKGEADGLRLLDGGQERRSSH
jgi:hypothetical protein